MSHGNTGNTNSLKYSDSSVKYILCTYLRILQENRNILTLEDLINSAEFKTYRLFFSRIKNKYAFQENRIRGLSIDTALQFALSDKANNSERIYLIYSTLQENIKSRIKEANNYREVMKYTAMLLPHKQSNTLRL